jgi:hypothetical protein
VIQFLRLDLQKWLSFLRDLRLLPRFDGVDASNLFLQNFEGNLTILPNRPSVNDYMNILSDPTKTRLEQYISDGQFRTWQAVSMIRNRHIIEECLMDLRDGAPTNTGSNSEGSNLASLTSDISDSPKIEGLSYIEPKGVPHVAPTLYEQAQGLLLAFGIYT